MQPHASLRARKRANPNFEAYYSRVAFVGLCSEHQARRCEELITDSRARTSPITVPQTQQRTRVIGPDPRYVFGRGLCVNEVDAMYSRFCSPAFSRVRASLSLRPGRLLNPDWLLRNAVGGQAWTVKEEPKVSMSHRIIRKTEGKVDNRMRDLSAQNQR